MKNFKLFLTLSLITILAVPAWGMDESYSVSSSAYTSLVDGDLVAWGTSDDELGESVGSNWLYLSDTKADWMVFKVVLKSGKYYLQNTEDDKYVYSSSDKKISLDATNKTPITLDANHCVYGGSSIGTYVYNSTGIRPYKSSDSYTKAYLYKVTTSGGSKVATPTFTPAAGSYSSAQSVTISCTTSGATIHYTTDGSTPTASSPTYSSAITVSSTKTIKAIAVKSGMTNSDVASATYTITASCSANIQLSFKGGSQTKPWTSCTLPTVIDDEDKCEGWDFAGWSETAISSTTDAPTLITSKTTDGTVYAVYSQGGSGTDGSITFNASAQGWANGTKHLSATVDPVTFTATGGDNTGNYYSSGTNWRFYGTESPTLTVAVPAGKTLKSIKVTFTVDGGGTMWKGSTKISSGTAVELSGSSVTFTFGTSGQIRISKMEVSYSSGGGSGGTYTTYCDMISSTELEIVEWNPDYINIMVPDPENATVVIEDKNEHKTTPILADKLFFSKYYEASSNMKLFAIYNGTGSDIDLRKYRARSASNSAGWGTAKGVLNYVEFGDISRLGTDYPGYMLPSGTELVFWSNNKGTGTAATNNTALRNCISMNIGGTTYKYSDMESDNVPNWYCLGGKNDYNTTDADGNNQFNFNGDDPIVLEEKVGAVWNPIDLIGAADGNPLTIQRGATDKITTTYKINGTNQALNDDPGWYATKSGFEPGTTTDTTLAIPYSTNRYMLIRKNFVRSGANAVKYNKTDFVTLGNYTNEESKRCEGEWLGIAVGGGNDNCYSGTMFSEVGQFDYNSSYEQYEHVTTVTDFDASNQNPDGSYRVEIPNLDTLACTKLKIILTGTTPATNFYDVPIMVEAGKATTDAIFHNYNKTEEICKTCDVVILTGGSLTKAANGAANDVPEVRNVTIYPGGELIVPSSTNYKVNSVRFRVEDEDVPGAKLKGSITSTMDSVYVTRRINNSRYYFMSVPYACKVNEIRWSNGEAATHGTDFAIREYNSQKRANNGWSAGAATNWDPVANDAVLQPMKGYVVAVATDYKSELVFPMKVDNTNLTTDEDNKTNTVTISEYTSSKTINNHNWNFIAQPYVCKLIPGQDADITVGKIANSTGKQDGWYYDDGGNEYLTFYVPSSNDYDQKVLSSVPSLDPFLAFFVQAQSGGGIYEFEKVNRINSAPARRYAAKSEYTDESIFVGVTLSGNGGNDQTNLRIRPDFNEEYQLGYDLAKFSTTSEKRPIIYMRNGIYDLAFRALNDNNAAMSQPMGVYCKAAGTYTFALSNDYSRDNIEAVYLYDAETQQTINLMNDTYEFTTTGNLNTGERFYLSAVVRRPAPQITTDSELVNEELPLTRKIILNGHVFIQHGGKLFDITGKEMLNH